MRTIFWRSLVHRGEEREEELIEPLKKMKPGVSMFIDGTSATTLNVSTYESVKRETNPAQWLENGGQREAFTSTFSPKHWQLTVWYL